MIKTDLIDRFIASKSEKAFLEMYREYTPRLYCIASRLCLNAEEINELVQLTWIRAVEEMDQHHKGVKFSIWLTRILLSINKVKIKERLQKSL